MIAVALIVLLLALLITIGVLVGGGESVTIGLFGSDVTTAAAGLYVTGVVSGVAALAALWLLRVGLRRGWRQRKRIQALERQAGRPVEGERDDPPPDLEP